MGDEVGYSRSRTVEYKTLVKLIGVAAADEIRQDKVPSYYVIDSGLIEHKFSLFTYLNRPVELHRKYLSYWVWFDGQTKNFTHIDGVTESTKYQAVLMLLGLRGVLKARPFCSAMHMQMAAPKIHKRKKKG